MVSEQENTIQRGLTLLFTGDGKGKTTAALGMLMRAYGHGFSLGMIQFMKGTDTVCGEIGAASALNITLIPYGSGFTWDEIDLQKARQMAVSAWDEAQHWIADRKYDLIVLDEFTYPLSLGWIKVNRVVQWLRTHKPEDQHLVITGRYAPQALQEYADLITEMKEIKHPYRTCGLAAQPGVEY